MDRASLNEQYPVIEIEVAPLQSHNLADSEPQALRYDHHRPFNTAPLFLKRSSSFSGSAAEAEEERIGRTTSNMLIRQVSGFFITLLLGGFERQINFRYLVRDELFGAFSRNGSD